MKSKTIKILAIDDNQDNLISIKAVIREVFPNALVSTALSGTKGLELAVVENPDVILLDIIMPGMNGFEVCEELKADKKLNGIPVVFLTSISGDKVSLIRALECGGDAFLSKPIDESELTAQILAMVKIRISNNERQAEKERLAALVEEQTHELHLTHAETLKLLHEVRSENEARKKSDQSLSESEKHYHDLFNSLIEGYCLIEVIFEENNKPVDYRFLEINDAFKDQSGLIDVEGKLMRDLAPEHEEYWFEIYGKVALTGESVQFENEAKALNRWFDVSAFRVGGQESRKVGVCFNDITERKKAENALHKSEERFRTMANAIPQLSWIANADGFIFWYNQRWYDYTGTTPEQMEGWGWQRVHDPEVLPNVLERWKNSIDTRKSFDMEFPLRGADGIFRPFLTRVMPLKDSAGHVIQWFGTNTDIADRKKAEEELRQSEERYKSIFHNNHSVMLLINPETGEIIDANPAACKYYGWSQDEMCSRNISDFNILSPEEVSVEMIKAKEEQRDHFFFRHRLANGEIRDVEVYSNPLQFGNTTLLYSIIHDITERKQAENALHESEKRVRYKLQSILSPEGSIAELELNDIIDAPSIQKLMENFYELTSIPMAIIDVGGKVLVGVGWQDICTKFHRVHPQSCVNCIESDVHLTHGIPDGEFRLYKCKNNMWDIATPLIIGGEHKGNLFMGQIFFDDKPIDYNLFRKQASQYGFDELAYMDALDRAPRLNQQKLEHAKAFFLNLAHSISQLSYSNIKLARAITQQKQSEEAIRISERRMDAVLNGVTETIMMLDTGGMILAVNQTAAQRWGLPAEDLIGRNVYSFLAPQSQEKLPLQIQLLIETGLPIQFDDERGDRSYNLTLYPICENSGAINQFVIFNRDTTEKKRTEKALLESEERFRNLVSNIPIGVILFGSNSEVILSNPKAIELLGVNENKVKENYTTTDWDTIREDGTPFPKSERPVPQTFTTGQPVKDVVIGVYRHETSDYIWLLINTVIVLHENGTIRNVIGTFIDITQQKKAEDELRGREQRLKYHFENSPLAVVEWDNNFIVTQWSIEAERIFGWTKEETIGKKIDQFNLIYVEDIPSVNHIMERLTSGKEEAVVSNNRNVTKSGSILNCIWYNSILLDQNGQMASVMSLVQDITQKKQIEEALRESEFFFRESQQAGFIGSYKIDFKTRLWETSDVLNQIFGIEKNDIRSIEGWFSLVYPDDRPMLYQHLTEEVIKKGNPFNKEFRIIRKDNGEIRWVLGLGSVSLDGNNNVEVLVGTLQDITRRKVKEEKLRKLNKTLAAMSKSSQAMSQAMNEAEYLNQVCKIVVDDIGFAMVWIGYAEEDKEKTIRPVASAGFKDDYLQTIQITWDDSELGQGPTGTAIRTDNISMCNNMYTDPAFEPWREQALKRGYASSIVFPLKTGDKTFGAITIYSRETESFLQDEIKLLFELANDLSHGITTIRLRAAHQLAEETLSKSYNELEMLVKDRTRELEIANDLLKKEINIGKQQEQSLKLAEQKYRTVADHTHGWEFWLDKEDHFLYCSPSCERITGYKASEFLKNPSLLYDIIHPNDKRSFLHHKKNEGLCQVRDYELEYRIIRNDGLIRWIGHECQPITDETGNFIGVRGSNKDITGRKQIEQLLKTSSRKYRLLSINITDGIFIYKGSYLEYVNKSMKRIFGYTHYKMEGLMLTQLALPEYHQELNNILTINSSINHHRNIEIECLKKDHSTIHVEILFNYIAKEKVIYGVVHDITEKKQLQKNIVKAIILTEEKERAHFSKELHDGLGPLLSTIKLYLQCSERPKAHTSRDEIIHQAEDIIEEALITVKEISNKLSPHLLINYGLTSAIQSFVDKLDETSVLKIDFESNVERRLGNEIEAALYRAVIECINNTIKHAGADRVSIILKDIDDQIQVQYRDNGKGFNLEETLPQKKGLGLYNLQNRIETIGGKILLFTSPGSGVDYQINVNL